MRFQHAPALTAAEAAELGRRLFGIDADASPLPSERDQNFVLRTESGDRFVLKIANRTDDRALLEAQNAALAHVARGSTLCPRVIPTTDGWEIAAFEASASITSSVAAGCPASARSLGDIPRTARDLARRSRNSMRARCSITPRSTGLLLDLARGCPGARRAPSIADPPFARSCGAAAGRRA